MLEINSLWKLDTRLPEVDDNASSSDNGTPKCDGKWHIVGKEELKGRLILVWKPSDKWQASHSNVVGKILAEVRDFFRRMGSKAVAPCGVCDTNCSVGNKMESLSRNCSSIGHCTSIAHQCHYHGQPLVDMIHYDDHQSPKYLVLKVALLDVSNRQFDIIFTHEEYYNVVHCAIDSDFQRLALPKRHSHIHASTRYQDKCEEREEDEVTYMCYWVLITKNGVNESVIQPLNQENPNFMKVHFFSNRHLLVFIPREAIYLYTLPSGNDSMQGGTQSPVLYERLCGPFLWAEWNAVGQQVFYLHLRSRLQQSHVKYTSTYSNAEHLKLSSNSGDVSPVLVALQFHSSSPFETVLNTPLELLIPFSWDSQVNKIVREVDNLNNCIYDPAFKVHLTVFTQPHGTIYICQDIVKQQQLIPSSIACEENVVNVKYSITVLHHGCTINSTIEGKIKDILVQKCVKFVPLRDCILVMLPGIFTHLLDIGVEHEPCNHILCFGCDLPCGDKNTLTFLPNVRNNCCYYEGPLICAVSSQDTIQIMSVNVTSQSLLSAFDHFTSISSYSSVRLAIFHHLLIHWDAVATVEMAMKSLMNDPANPQFVKLLQEFLIGGAFARTKQRESDKITSVLTMSGAQPFHPQQETTLDGQMQMIVTYTMLKDATSVLLSPNERHFPSRKIQDLWYHLWNNLKIRSHASSVKSLRFSSKAMRDRLLALGSPQVLKGIWPTISPSSSSTINFPLNWNPVSSVAEDNCSRSVASFCDRFLGAAVNLKKALMCKQENESYGSKDERDIFDADDGYSQLEHIVSLNLREVTVHLSKSLSGETAGIIHNSACNYVADRLHQSQVLCHLLFQLLDMDPFVQGYDGNPYIFIDDLPPVSAQRLFMVLERYYVAAEEAVFPLPQGFEAFFSVLAFKCLPLQNFLQYVDYGVVQLTSEVLSSITAYAASVQDADNEDDNALLEIISRLPRKKALCLLQHLKTPTGNIFHVNHIVNHYLKHRSEKTMHIEAEDDKVFENACNSDDVSSCDYEEETSFDVLPQALPCILAGMNSLLHHLQGGDDWSRMTSSSSSSSSRTFSSTCASPEPSTSYSSDQASSMTRDMHLIRNTQLNNIATKTIRSKPPFYMTIRPPLSYWR